MGPFLEFSSGSDDPNCEDSDDSSLVDHRNEAAAAMEKKERAEATAATRVMAGNTRVYDRGYGFIEASAAPVGRVYASNTKTSQYKVTCLLHQTCSLFVCNPDISRIQTWHTSGWSMAWDWHLPVNTAVLGTWPMVGLLGLLDGAILRSRQLPLEFVC